VKKKKSAIENYTLKWYRLSQEEEKEKTRSGLYYNKLCLKLWNFWN